MNASRSLTAPTPNRVLALGMGTAPLDPDLAATSQPGAPPSPRKISRAVPERTAPLADHDDRFARAAGRSTTLAPSAVSQGIDRGPDHVRVRGLHRWEGVVIDVGDRLFTASLLPVDHDSVPLEADFVLDDLADQDREQLKLGSVVYLTARTVISAHGQKERTASLRIRRTSTWTATEVSAIRREAEELGEALAQLAD